MKSRSSNTRRGELKCCATVSETPILQEKKVTARLTYRFEKSR